MEGKTRKLLEQIKKSNFANYPISNALLTNETDYIKNNYFRHLALVLTQKGEVSENQRYLFSRLLVGANAESDIEEYLRQAFDIEIEQYVEFMNQMKEKELRYRFLLDATLITCCDAYDAEQQELLAAFMESLKMSLKEAEFLCVIGKSILEQDKKNYWEQIRRNEDIAFRNFAEEYALGYAGEYLELVTKDSLFLYFPEKREISKEFLVSKGVQNGIINGFAEVKVDNIIFDVGKEDLLVKGCKKVLFENCEFLGGECGINIVDDGELVFRNCTFTDFTKRAIRIFCGTDTTVGIYGCSFKKCYLYESRYDKRWIRRGGVIWSEKKSMIKIEGSSFNDCGVVNTHRYYSSAIILNQQASIKSCAFNNCWGYNDTSAPSGKCIDPENGGIEYGEYEESGSSLFAKGSVNEGNVIVNSASFYAKPNPYRET